MDLEGPDTSASPDDNGEQRQEQRRARSHSCSHFDGPSCSAWTCLILGLERLVRHRTTYALSARFPASKDTKTDLTETVGRVHYSLGLTQSAQFR